MITVLKSKIHQVRVTEANINYKGSITIDIDLMEAANILPFELVHINNKETGFHWETYVIPGNRKTGCIKMNGAAAKNFKVGDNVHILSFMQITKKQYKYGYKPVVVHTNEDNNAFTHYGNI